MSKLKIHTLITLGILFVVSTAAVANASLIDYLNGGYDTEIAGSEVDGSGGRHVPDELSTLRVPGSELSGNTGELPRVDTVLE